MSRTQRILWTSGWDSTFQLMRYLVTDTAPIQPIYLVDETRPSTAMELLAMKRIKQRIRADFPDQAGRLLPVQIVCVSDLLENDKMTRAISEIRRRHRLGIQYEWLGRFCRQFGVAELDLCIHRDDHAHDVLQHVVEDGASGQGYRVGDRHAGTAEHELFKPYKFPVFNLTKLQMKAMAKEMGFGPIMELTWFCHDPKNGKPCGVCRPCHYTIEEGLGSRVPYLRRLKGKLSWTALRLAKAGMAKMPLRRRPTVPPTYPAIHPLR